MKIYTKTGDAGETGLYGAGRVLKDDPRIEAIGTVDELNAVIGFVRVEPLPAELDAILHAMQHDLFTIGAELATVRPDDPRTPRLPMDRVTALETAIDDWDARLPTLSQFILPSGSRAATGLHLARAVGRRAERCLVHLSKMPSAQLSATLIVYLNRASDLFFVLARSMNRIDGVTEEPWEKPSQP